MADELINTPANPASLPRQFSARLIFEAILRQGTLSRADMAKVTGLSKQTVSEVIGAFEQQGWVEPAGQSSGKVGRTALLYQLRGDAAYAAGIDLGGTKIALSLADLTGRMVAETIVRTPAQGGYAVLAQIVLLLRQQLAARDIPYSRLKSVTVGTPGVLQPETGSIAYSPNISGLDNIDVLAYLRQHLAVPVQIENDANMALIGEYSAGAASQINNVIFIALGTGLGMSLMINGQLIRGHRGLAGEIGYLPLGPDLMSADARKYGALEAETGTDGILRRYVAKGGSPSLTVRDMFDRLPHDVLARQTLQETAYWMALGIVSASVIVDPQRVIMGGSVGMREELLAMIKTEVNCLSLFPPDIECSQLGSRAGVIGAVATALGNIHLTQFGAGALPVVLSSPPSPPSEKGPDHE